MEEDSSMTVAWCQKGVGLWSFRLFALWREARMHRALEVVSRHKNENARFRASCLAS
jgi:hypothetical protein